MVGSIISSYANNNVDTAIVSTNTIYDYQAKYVQVCQYVRSTGQTFGCETWYGTVFMYYNSDNDIFTIRCPANLQLEATYQLMFTEVTTDGIYYVATGLPSGYSATFLFAKNGIIMAYVTPTESFMVTYGFWL